MTFINHDAPRFIILLCNYVITLRSKYFSEHFVSRRSGDISVGIATGYVLDV
jgi:hypothetical protein